MVVMDEFWERTERMHEKTEKTEKNKMQRHMERMAFDREMMKDFFGMMQDFREHQDSIFKDLTTNLPIDQVLQGQVEVMGK